MILNGKAKEDFFNYVFLTGGYMLSEFWQLKEIHRNALIIEWLDTLRYAGKPMFKICFDFYWNLKISSQSFNDICKQAIEKCNEIYNESKL